VPTLAAGGFATLLLLGRVGEEDGLLLGKPLGKQQEASASKNCMPRRKESY
jgi:hypothetical protein